jgi:hypothetical protein
MSHAAKAMTPKSIRATSQQVTMAMRYSQNLMPRSYGAN